MKVSLDLGALLRSNKFHVNVHFIVMLATYTLAIASKLGYATPSPDAQTVNTVVGLMATLGVLPHLNEEAK